MNKCLLYPICLDYPEYKYFSQEKHRKLSKKWKRIKKKYKTKMKFIPYPCPEIIFGIPRIPAGKNTYRNTKLVEYIKEIVKFFKGIKMYYQKAYLIGISGSPTCGVYTTSFCKTKIKLLPSKEEINKALKSCKKIKGSGLLIDELKKERIIDGFYEISIKSKIKDIEKIIKEIIKKND